MKPINLGKITFSRNNNKFNLRLQGKKTKFNSLQEAIDYSNVELEKIALATKKSLTVTIKDHDNYLTSNLVVTVKAGKVSSEIVSRSLFELENRRYFTAEEIEAHLPLRRINANGLARVNMSRSRKTRHPFIILFTLLMLCSLILLAFSIMKINGVGMAKIDILKKIMQGKEDHDIYNTCIAVSSFVFAVIMIGYTAIIHNRRLEIRDHGTYKNDEWSKLYVNNEIRKHVSISLMSILLAVSIVQVVLLHESYVFSVIGDWYVAIIVVTASYVQIGIVATLLVIMILKFVLSKRRFVRRLRRILGLSYIKFLELVKDKEHVKANANLFKDKELAIRVDGIKTRFPDDKDLTERRVHKLPSEKVRVKLWAKEEKDKLVIKAFLKKQKQTKVA